MYFGGKFCSFHHQEIKKLKGFDLFFVVCSIEIVHFSWIRPQMFSIRKLVTAALLIIYIYKAVHSK